MNKRITGLLRKCKTLSRQLSRSSSSGGGSVGGLRSKSARDYYQQLSASDLGGREREEESASAAEEAIFVGSSRRRYVISSEHLNHPLLSALIERSRKGAGSGRDPDPAVVKCEVVLFDHLLWMLENADPNISSDSLEELAELYIY